MENIPNAKQSPRIETGVLKWYARDTFSLVIELDLTDQDGEAVTIAPSDTVTAVFSDANGDTVKTFTFTNVEHDTVTLEFDGETSALFAPGRYTYTVALASAERRTLAAGNEVIVE